jgi:Spy/CpxP family protein refolding chaperone
MLAAFAAITGATAVHAQGTPADHPRGPGRGGPAMMDSILFKGITLTDGEKTQLTELRQAERAKMQAAGGAQQGRGDFQAIREARQKGDTATANHLMSEQRTKMEARRDEQFAAIRGLLTAEQQKQFDANVAEMKQHQMERAPGRGHKPSGV